MKVEENFVLFSPSILPPTRQNFFVPPMLGQKLLPPLVESRFSPPFRPTPRPRMADIEAQNGNFLIYVIKSKNRLCLKTWLLNLDDMFMARTLLIERRRNMLNNNNNNNSHDHNY